MTEMVRLDRLAKHFGPVHAVEEVSFAVARGEVLGFLGPNGAGKSTTMRMVTGFIPPSSGTASVMGFDVVQAPIEVKRRVGYLPEGAPLYGDMTALAFLRFVAEMRGLHGEERNRRIDAAIARTQLEEVAHRPIETLSKGFKRRVGFACAIVHDPAALVLDEPTDGLDPNQKHEVRGLISELARQRTLLLSTHILEEVEAVCTRAIIIAGGKIRADATPAQLLAKSRYHQAVSLRPTDSIAARAALDGMPGVSGFEHQEREGRLYVFPQGQARLLDAVEERLRQRGVAFGDLRLEQGRLDEVFRRITGEQVP